MKRFFLTRSFREKTLLVAFVSLVAIAWLLSGAGRARARLQDWQSLRASGEEQRLWLTNRTEIEARAAKATAQLDPAKTLNGTRLVAEMSSLAAQAGLTAEVSGQRTERTTQFAFHSAQVTFRRAEMNALVKFYEALSARSPYVGLEQVSLAADRGAPGALNATFRVTAAELQR
jgi:hypothetical protein